jgi:hypothetical protein
MWRKHHQDTNIQFALITLLLKLNILKRNPYIEGDEHDP